jgi:hypothetical protein
MRAGLRITMETGGKRLVIGSSEDDADKLVFGVGDSADDYNEILVPEALQSRVKAALAHVMRVVDALVESLPDDDTGVSS